MNHDLFLKTKISTNGYVEKNGLKHIESYEDYIEKLRKNSK